MLRTLVLLTLLLQFGCGEPTVEPRDTSVASGDADVSVQVSDMGPDGADLAASDASDGGDVANPDVAVADDMLVADTNDVGDISDIADSGGGDALLVTSLAVVIDRDIDPAPTPINDAYVAEIDATTAGDEIIAYQKYFRSEAVTVAMLEAARRGVTVRGFYGDDVDPSCESLLEAADTIDCDAVFTKSSLAHHKNMLIQRADGVVRGIIGSYNLRVRSSSNPHAHTVLLFEVANGAALFDFYAAEADRLTGTATTQALTMDVPVAGGGEISLTFHPGQASPVLDLLNGIQSCDGTLWVSYFDALPDAVGTPIFDRLQELVGLGCDVRVMFSDELTNTVARLALINRGVPVEEPDYPAGDGTLGHKIVSVVSNGEAHIIQSSANIGVVNHRVNNNLTVRITVPNTDLHTALETELLRYWP